jgi:hypothetical protein
MFMNLPQTNNTYAEFRKVDGTRISIIILSLLISIVDVLMMTAIIWYERFVADNTRILTNKLVSVICFNGIIYVLSSFISNVAIYSVVPLSKIFWMVSAFVRLSIISNIAMFLNLIMIWAQCYKTFFVRNFRIIALS